MALKLFEFQLDFMIDAEPKQSFTPFAIQQK